MNSNLNDNDHDNGTILVERVETKETTIEVEADTPQEAFDKARAGEGHEIGTVKKSELVIRDYAEEVLAQPAASVG